MALSIHDCFTNPTSPRDLMFGEDRFSCKGFEYAYSEVQSLRYFETVIEHYRNFSRCATSFVSEFDIKLRNQPKPIRIRPRGGTVARLYAEYSQDLQDEVRHAHRTLAQKTFTLRLQGYEEMLKQYGCLRYDGKTFYPDGRVTDGNITVNVQVEAKNGTFRKRPFSVYVVLPKSPVGKFFNRLAQRDIGIPGLKERDFVISTENDVDVFFSMVKRLYGLRWD